jgi:tetratricopeptide (TPR) repeat protein
LSTFRCRQPLLPTLLAGLATLCVPGSLAGGQAEAGNYELRDGIAAYESGRYGEAIDHFKRAAAANPAQVTAKKYLGMALAETVVPGLDTPESLEAAQQAIAVFLQVLEKDTHDADSMQRIAAVEFSVKNFEEAKDWQKKVLNEDPKAAESAYMVGVIDWTLSHENVLAILEPAGFSDDGEGNARAPAALMGNIEAQNHALVEEGIDYLNWAIKIRPDYEDAMAYLNLVCRRKADLDWGDEAARKADLAEANEWTIKAMNLRSASEKKAAGQKANQEAVSEQP